MKLKLLICGLFLIASVRSVVSSVRCHYTVAELMYACFLHIDNPNGRNDFTAIEGTHLPGRSNADVTFIYGVATIDSLNFPSIVCNTFTNALRIHLFRNTQIKKIGANSFSGCSRAKYLNLLDNHIDELEENAFANLGDLEELNLGSNNVVELPQNIFKPLVNLRKLEMYTNELEVIYSDAFGMHPQLTEIYLSRNRLNAISPAILDNTAVGILWLSLNVCVNRNFNNEPDAVMRENLNLCFENYRDLDRGTPPTISPPTVEPPITTKGPDSDTTTPYPDTPTTTPRYCSNENIYQRVCDLEEKLENLDRSHHALTRVVEDMARQVYELQHSKEYFMNILTEIIQFFYDLINRPRL